MKIAMSTVACPSLSLEQVAESASSWGYQGAEFRVNPEPDSSRQTIACDPMDADPKAFHDLFEDAGVDPVCLATGIRYDQQPWPPVVGHVLFSNEVGVPETKRVVEQAAESGTAFVRVFGFDLPGGEPRAWGVKRVAQRLELAAQTARNTAVRLLVENGGSFGGAQEIRELTEMAPSPFLGISYNMVAGAASGDDPARDIKPILANTRVIKIGDIRDDGSPVPLGQGTLDPEGFLHALKDMGYTGWVVYEWPKLWRPELADASEVLPRVADMFYRVTSDSQSAVAV